MVGSRLTILFALFLTGCVFHSEPEGNRDFHHLSQLSELEGVYNNKGNPNGFLSQVIWGASTDKPPVVNDQAVEFIEVTSAANSLKAKAIQNGCVIYERSYVLGRDFEIEDGKISIRKDISLLTRGSGDVLVGPSYEKTSLGLDLGKNGKLRNSGYSAGLAFLFLPIAMAASDDVRFDRISDKPKVYKDCATR